MVLVSELDVVRHNGNHLFSPSKSMVGVSVRPTKGEASGRLANASLRPSSDCRDAEDRT